MERRISCRFLSPFLTVRTAGRCKEEKNLGSTEGGASPDDRPTFRAARAADASAFSASQAAAEARCLTTAASSPLFCFCSVASIACRGQQEWL